MVKYWYYSGCRLRRKRGGREGEGEGREREKRRKILEIGGSILGWLDL